MSAPRVGVSADAFVAVVRAYADRVHDDVRRLGCTRAEAAEVVEASALGLAERLRTRPHEVRDLVGAWFRDARVYAERVGSGVDADELAAGEGIVRRSEDDAAARQALSELGERDRVALLLRDAYDLPYVSAGVALGLDQNATANVVARARLKLLRLTGAAQVPPDPEEHAELSATARLAEGQLPPEEARDAERHVARCPVCGPLLPALREARRLLSGLAILAMADADRDALIQRAEAVAARHLPTAAEVAAAADAPEPRVLPPMLLTLGCLGGAFLLGALVALSGDDTSLSARGGGGVPTFAPPSATPTPTPTSATPTPTPTAKATTVAPTVTATRTVTPTRTATPSPTPTYTWFVGSERISISPASGPNGATVVVTGTGWAPQQPVTIRYLTALGTPTGQQAVGIPDAQGRFSTEIVAQDPANIPGRHDIQAENAEGQEATARYTAQP
jgi:DNA-directed RNA polymerase specialized sigma24 family protein